MQYTLTVPYPSILEANVVRRDLTILVNGQLVAHDAPPATAEYFAMDIELEEGDVVAGVLFHVNNANLAGPPRTEEVLVGRIDAPSQPGRFTLELVPRQELPPGSQPGTSQPNAAVAKSALTRPLG